MTGILWFYSKDEAINFNCDIAGQGEDYTTECLLGYECIESHYRLIEVDLSRQK